MRNSFLFIFVTTAAIFAAFSCAPLAKVQMVTYESQMLTEADRYFANHKYPEAVKLYRQICAGYPTSPVARTAQFRLGYAYLYYKNPLADWKLAQRELATFTRQFPGDELADEANTWLRLLAVLNSFEGQYSASTAKLRDIQSKRMIPRTGYDSLFTALQRCDIDRQSFMAERDSLSQKIKTLEQLILKLENIDKSR